MRNLIADYQKRSLAERVRDVLDVHPDAAEDSFVLLAEVWGTYIDNEEWTLHDLQYLNKNYNLPAAETIIVTKRRILNEQKRSVEDSQQL